MICQKKHRYDPQHNNLPEDQEGMEDIGVRDVLMKKGIKMDSNAKSN